MKKILPLFASFVFVTACAFAQSAPDAAQTELGARMEKINTPWRKLRRQIADPAQTVASLELIAKIREAAKGTEQMTPAKTAELPESQRAKFQAGYADGMKKFFGQLDSLEAALKAGDNIEAGKVVAAISDYQRESHKEFRKEADKK